MSKHIDGATVKVWVSRVIAYSSLPEQLRMQPADASDLGLESIEWRIDGTPSISLVRCSADPHLPAFPDRRYRTTDRTDFALRCEGLACIVQVSRVGVECPAGVLDDPSALVSWASEFESQNPLRPYTSAADESGRAAPSYVGARSSDYICIAELAGNALAALKADRWQALSSDSCRRQLQVPTSDFWAVQPSMDAAGRTKVDANTVLFLFAIVALKNRTLRDTVTAIIESLVRPLSAAAARGTAAEETPVEWLGHPECRRSVLDSQRSFLLAKLCFDEVRVAKWGDADGPIYACMLRESGSSALVSERERDFDSLTSLVTGAALYSELRRSIKGAGALAKALAVFGVLGTVAGVLQAIDRSETALPLASNPSWMRAMILVAIFSFAGIVITCGWYVVSRSRRTQP